MAEGPENLPLSPNLTERRDELNKYLDSCSWRMEEEQLQAFKHCVRQLSTLRPEGCLHWEDDGQFANEYLKDDNPPSDDDDEVEPEVQINDGSCIIRSQNVRRELNNQPLANTVSIGTFIAYKPFYTDDVPTGRRKPMYIGEITLIDRENQKVQIKTYFTGSTKPLEKKCGTSVKYKPWRKRGESFQDVRVSDIYYGFTPKLD